MAAPISILLFGQDPVLLSTRQWVLSSNGHQVYLAADLASATRILADEPVDLLVLCHTLSPEDRDQAIALTTPKDSRLRRAQKRFPKIKHLVLVAGAAGSQEAGSDVLNAMSGPAQLVSRVQSLVGDGSTAYSHFF
jgi:CheY-like chemotaxis protein